MKVSVSGCIDFLVPRKIDAKTIGYSISFFYLCQLTQITEGGNEKNFKIQNIMCVCACAHVCVCVYICYFLINKRYIILRKGAKKTIIEPFSLRKFSTYYLTGTEECKSKHELILDNNDSRGRSKREHTSPAATVIT